MGFFMIKNKMIILGACSCCLFMVIYPEVTASASKEAISLWLNAVVPTLFPFMIIADFLKRTGMINRMPIRAYPCAMAVLSGYPMGARIAGDAYREGHLQEKELYHILSYSMVTGPALIVGAVGVELFGSRMLGYILAVSHYGAAVVNRWFYGDFSCRKRVAADAGAQEKACESYYTFLTESILDSFKTIGIILAYIMMFMIGTDILQFSGVFSFIHTDYGVALTKGIFEMTVGCNALHSCQCTTLLKLVLTSFLISFGGLSVLGQSMSMLKGCPITLLQLLRIKLSHGIISGILTFTLYAFVV